jgi:hypothetical protein
MNKKESHINETLEKLTELVHNQDKALEMANQIIKGKNVLIELCEKETALYKKVANIRGIIILILSACMIITSLINILDCYET